MKYKKSEEPLTSTITSVNIRKYNQDKASNTDNYTSYLFESIFCFQEKPSEKHDRWNGPAVKQHDACQ